MAISKGQKLNFLIPIAKCRMEGDGVSFRIWDWKDSRPQPTMAEIDAVTDQQVIDAKLDSEANAQVSGHTKKQKLIFNINYDQEKRLRILEGKPSITKSQYKDALIAEYITL